MVAQQYYKYTTKQCQEHKDKKKNETITLVYYPFSTQLLYLNGLYEYLCRYGFKHNYYLLLFKFIINGFYLTSNLACLSARFLENG